MSGELWVISGWTFPQWRKAIEYYDQCNPDDRFGRNIANIVNDMHCGHGGPWFAVQKFWRERRLDQPLEATILTLDADGGVR